MRLFHIEADIVGAHVYSALALTGAEAARSSCRHCGDPCGDRAVRAGGESFCCAGCQSVFMLLRDRGLQGFYACDVKPGVSQKDAAEREPARFAALDDPAVAARMLEFDDGLLAGVTFALPDLHCASCLWLLERLYHVDSGIVRAEADLVRRTVHVWFRPQQISLRRVAERLAAIGYEPTLAGEGRRAGMSPARRSLYLKLAVAGFAFGNIMLFSIPRYANGVPLDGGFQRLFDTLNLVLALPVLLYSASGYFRTAWEAVTARRIVLEVPVAIGLAVLFLRSTFDILTSRGEGFLDSFTGLVLFLLVAKLFQQKAFDRIAFDRTFRSFLPLSVRVERAGVSSMVPLEQVHVGDCIVVRPHEIVPADSVLLTEEGSVDYAFVTGESRPVAVRKGEAVRAGGRAAGTTLRLSATREVAHSQLASLWSNPAFRRSKHHWMTDISARFGAWFTVVATGLALAGAAFWWPDVDTSLQVATAVLIIACPCALTLAAPITLGTAMEMLGRRGLYLKDAAVALDLGRADTVAFDKTGTLTTAAAGATAEPSGLSDDEWRLVRRLAAESVHPVSRAIASVAPASSDVETCHEVAGGGLRGRVDGHDVVLGTAAFVERQSGVAVSQGAGTAIAIDGRFCGWVRLAVPARHGVEHAAEMLSRTHEVLLVSGDDNSEASRWRRVFGDRMWFRQSPEDKLAAIRMRQTAGRHVLMVGDGLNDAGALAAADVGVAVSDETACVVPACDAVIQGNRLAHLPAFLRYGRRARQVIVTCFLVSLVYNAIGLSLALGGLLTPLVAAILMPVSSLTIVGLAAGGMRWYARELGA